MLTYVLLHVQVKAQSAIPVVNIFNFYDTAASTRLTGRIERTIFGRTDNVAGSGDHIVSRVNTTGVGVTPGIWRLTEVLCQANRILKRPGPTAAPFGRIASILVIYY